MILTSADITAHTGLTSIALHELDNRGFFKPSLRQAAGSGSRRLYSQSDLAAIAIGLSLRARNVAWPVIAELNRHVQSLSLEALEAKPIYVLFQTPDNQTEIHAVKERKDFIAPGDGMAVFVDIRATIAAVRKAIAGPKAPRRRKVKA